MTNGKHCGALKSLSYKSTTHQLVATVMSESTRQRTVREEGERWEEYVTEYLRRELVKRGFSVYRERNFPPEAPNGVA